MKKNDSTADVQVVQERRKSAGGAGAASGVEGRKS